MNCNLIPCARHLLVEQRITAEQEFAESVGHEPSSFVHIAMIVQLPRLVGGCQSFAGFQGGHWISVHIDELHPPTGQIPAIEFMVDRSVSELFDVAPTTTRTDDMEVEEEQQEAIDIEIEAADLASSDTILDKVDIVSLLRSCVQAAVARIDDESWRSSRSTRRIDIVLNLLPENRSSGTGKYRPRMSRNADSTLSCVNDLCDHIFHLFSFEPNCNVPSLSLLFFSCLYRDANVFPRSPPCCIFPQCSFPCCW